MDEITNTATGKNGFLKMLGLAAFLIVVGSLVLAFYHWVFRTDIYDAAGNMVNTWRQRPAWTQHKGTMLNNPAPAATTPAPVTGTQG